MNENERTKLYQLSDVDKNTELYKIFEEDINFFNFFFSFEKYSKTINQMENLREFINNPLFNDFQQYFQTFLQNKKENSFSYVFDLLSFLYKIRPKLLPIIIFISTIALKFYSPHIKEVLDYLSNPEKGCHLFSILLKIIDEYPFFHEFLKNKSPLDINIKMIQNKFLEHPEYLTLFSQNIEETEYDDENIEKIISIIIQDDYNELITFLTKHPEFDIKSPVQIPPLHQLYQLVNLKMESDIDISISLIDLCCFFGSNNCFKYFIMNSNNFSPETNEYCIIGGNYEILQILIQNNFDFNNCIKTSVKYHQYSLIDWLIINYDDVELVSNNYCIHNYNFLFFLFIQNNTFHNEVLSNSLLDFSYIGHLPIIVYIIKHGCNIECPSNNGSTPLAAACCYGHLPIVEYLIQHGCNIECKDNNGFTPLNVACEKGHLPIVEYLIQHGCNIECPNNDGFTPLHAACEKGHLPIVEYLIQHRCNIDCQDNNGWTPLNVACEKGHLPIVEYLIQHKCNIECKDNNGFTPLHDACFNDYLPIVEYLIQHGCNIDCQNNNGWTPLNVACEKGHLPIVEYLIQHGCNIECQNDNGWTPLNVACEKGYLPIVEYLIQHGCNIDCPNNIGFTPLHSACYYGHHPIVEYLIQHKCNIECQDEDGKMPLDYALEMNYQDIVNILKFCNK